MRNRIGAVFGGLRRRGQGNSAPPPARRAASPSRGRTSGT